MNMNWNEFAISAIGDVIGGGTPSTKHNEYYGDEIAWITPKDLSNFNGRYISRGERSISQKGYDNSSAQMMPAGTVLFSSRAPIGYVAIAKNELCTNQGFKSVVPHPEICDSEFLYYLLCYRKHDIEAIASGTTFMEVSGTALKNFVVHMPDISTQKKIASVLSSLDQRIEGNNLINHNLEEQAKAIFKSWFVDFDPFQNGAFVDSELGQIPAGWNVGTLKDMLEIRYGKDHKKLADGAFPVYGSGGLMRYAEKALFSGESVLIPRKGTLNNVMRVTGDFWTVDTMFYSVPKKAGAAKYTYHILSALDLASMNSGSAVPSMTTDILNAIKIVLPAENVLKEFDRLTSFFWETIETNKMESQRLAQLRDALLPKLMSGEIDVSEVEI